MFDSKRLVPVVFAGVSEMLDPLHKLGRGLVTSSKCKHLFCWL